jgi:tRNA A37 threonylcarbamoyladenosine biosynthesis protein TsaE
VSHLDLYRFKSVSPAEWGDLEPYFDDAVCFVEWPEAAGDDLPPVRAAVTLQHVAPPGQHRRIVVDAPGDLLQRFRA